MRTVGRSLPFVLACAALAAAAACAEPPTKEMNQAQGAIDAARAAGAAEYATEEFEAAEATLARSHQAVSERDYRLALNYALDARDRAQTAARTAADEKARMRTEADRALRAADATLERARERLATAVEARLPAKTLADPKRIIAEAESSLASAHTAFDKDQYRQAVSGLTDLQVRLTAVTSQIDAAIEARPARRPARRGR
jgi:hypothetical protein